MDLEINNKFASKKYKGKTGQEIQDSIFAKMSADKKISLVSGLTMFCLELNRINGNSQITKIKHGKRI